MRIVEGRAGSVRMRMEALFRFDYDRITPWLRNRDYGLHALAGPHALQLRTPLDLDDRADNLRRRVHRRQGTTHPVRADLA